VNNRWDSRKGAEVALVAEELQKRNAVIRSLSNLEYKAGASVPDPKSDHSHMADAVGYACIALAKGLLPYTIGESGFRVV